MASDNNLKGLVAIWQELDDRGLSRKAYDKKLGDYLEHLAESPDEYETLAALTTIQGLLPPFPCWKCGTQSKPWIKWDSRIGAGGGILLFLAVPLLLIFGGDICKSFWG